MPAVGMRRTTRVFGVVKGVDGARVLRSGRRILPDSREIKLRRTHDVENWSLDSILKDQSKGKRPQTSVGASVGVCHRQTRSKSQALTGKREEKEEIPRVRKRRKVIQSVKDKKSADKKMFGTVYCRKRKRLDNQKRDLLRSCRNFRQNNTSKDVSVCRPELVFAVDGSCNGNSWFWSVFNLVLRYMRKAELKLSDLTTFFLTQPVNAVFTDHGVRLLLEPPVNSRGICKFFASIEFQALLSLDFSVAPKCFMQMHYSALQRTVVLSSRFVNRHVFLLQNSEGQPVEDFNSDDAISFIEATSSENGSKLQLDSSVSALKFAGRNAQCRNSLNSRSFQKRRSSRKRTRSRNVSLGVHKVCNKSSASGQIGCKKATPVKNHRSSYQLSLASNSNGTSSSTKDLNSECSYANILVIDSGRCFREEGFSIMLESSSSKEWFLVIKRNGSTRFMLKAGKVMRPYSHNRVTNSILWTGDGNWKLEFCNRQEWVAFKDLYKECFNRNVSASNSKVIPIPGVQEVAGYENFNINGDVPSFCRPESYILVKDDEVSRAMARITGIYDMDSEDDEWLRKLNGEFTAENEKIEKLSADSFELMIDGLEKGYFGCQADYAIGKAASSLSHLADREVVESVYSYWMNKRKQKKAPLLRVFQGHQTKKIALGSKHVYRKRRSFKRQTSQLCGRSNQPSLLQENSARQENASEEQKECLKIKEAEAAAASSTEVAIKRQERAQILMEIADLAVYKAVMALRIAEALQVGEVFQIAELTESAATDFLD